MAILIYFSKDGENYLNGQKQMLSKGNTAIVAEKIAKQLAIEAVALIPQKPYPTSYDATVDLAKTEQQEQARPQYQPLDLDLTDEQELFIGYPNWWGTFPMIVATFLEANDLSDKTIYPFCTHEGSALGSSMADLARFCPGSTIKQGLAIRGSIAAKADKAVEQWLLQYHCACGSKQRGGQ